MSDSYPRPSSRPQAQTPKKSIGTLAVGLTYLAGGFLSMIGVLVASASSASDLVKTLSTMETSESLSGLSFTLGLVFLLVGLVTIFVWIVRRTPVAHKPQKMIAPGLTALIVGPYLGFSGIVIGALGLRWKK
jgi:hypothetical protein